MIVYQSLPDRFSDNAAHGEFLAEFNFALGRVDIDIDRSRIDFQEKAAERVAAFHQHRVIAFEEGIIQSAVFHGPAVYENMVVIASCPGNARSADESPNMNAVRAKARLAAGGLFRNALLKFRRKIERNKFDIARVEGA